VKSGKEEIKRIEMDDIQMPENNMLIFSIDLPRSSFGSGEYSTLMTKKRRIF